MSKQTNHDSTPEASTIANPIRREIAQLLDELRSVSDERLPGVRERLDALVDAVGQTGSAYANGVRTQTNGSPRWRRTKSFIPATLPRSTCVRIHGARWRRSARLR